LLESNRRKGKTEKEQLIMINLARGSVFLNLAALIIGFFYIQPQVGAAFFAADYDSQEQIQGQVQQQQGDEKTTRPRIVEENKTTPIENKAVVSSSNAEGTTTYTATAYCLQGRTAMGGGVRRGIVAADSRSLPLGSRIFVNAGSYSGSYLVADTGGGVKGHKLDIWVPSCAEAARFGRRTVTVKKG
jgi:3D (Asp-Asp-Asp) domain-containing protein